MQVKTAWNLSLSTAEDTIVATMCDVHEPYESFDLAVVGEPAYMPTVRTTGSPMC